MVEGRGTEACTDKGRRKARRRKDLANGFAFDEGAGKTVIPGLKGSLALHRFDHECRGLLGDIRDGLADRGEPRIDQG